MLDTDGDGNVSKEEFYRACDAVRGPEVSGETDKTEEEAAKEKAEEEEEQRVLPLPNSFPLALVVPLTVGA